MTHIRGYKGRKAKRKEGDIFETLKKNRIAQREV